MGQCVRFQKLRIFSQEMATAIRWALLPSFQAMLKCPALSAGSVQAQADSGLNKLLPMTSWVKLLPPASPQLAIVCGHGVSQTASENERLLSIVSFMHCLSIFDVCSTTNYEPSLI